MKGGEGGQGPGGTPLLISAGRAGRGPPPPAESQARRARTSAAAAFDMARVGMLSGSAGPEGQRTNGGGGLARVGLEEWEGTRRSVTAFASRARRIWHGGEGVGLGQTGQARVRSRLGGLMGLGAFRVMDWSRVLP